MSECFAKSEFPFLEGNLLTSDGDKVGAFKEIRHLQTELAQAQAKGAEMVGILGICMQALEFHVPYREEGEIAFIGVEGAKRLLEGNPGQALLDRLEKLERVRDGAALALYAEEHLLGCDSYARKLREALAAGPPKESLPEGGETCRWMKKNGSKMTTT